MPKETKEPRLSPLEHLPRSNIARRFAPTGMASERVVTDAIRSSGKETVVRQIRDANPLIKPAAEIEPKKRGRPSIGKPWEADGISKAEWYRRQKAKK